MQDEFTKKKGITTRELVVLSLLSAILLVVQVGMAVLPNIELVSLLVLVYTQVFRKKAFYIIYLFVFLEGMIYGFGIWWFSYLYLWSILAVLTMLFAKNKSVLVWALLNGAFGLFFGALCAIPYFAGGFYAGFSYWLQGIPFDIAHCAGNFVLTLVLYEPFVKILRQLQQMMG